MADGATPTTPPDDPDDPDEQPSNPQPSDHTPPPATPVRAGQGTAGPGMAAGSGRDARSAERHALPASRVTYPGRLILPVGSAEAVSANGGGPSVADGADLLDPAGRAYPDQPGGIDSRRFRSILGRFATGVVAVTAVDPETGRPTGLAANSFTSVSLEPPLVSFCVAHTSATWPKLRKVGRFCVNVLSRPQRDVCLQLAARGADKFAGLEWSTSPAGAPVIDGALAWLDCSVEAEYVAGDHVIVVSRVHELDRHHDGEPLVFFKGAYGGFAG
jgi:3-hydroxy-9,10-secoandrosta-1,3,5(10)-triene-9,17-dione monooxygenase reductase component